MEEPMVQKLEVNQMNAKVQEVDTSSGYSRPKLEERKIEHKK